MNHQQSVKDILEAIESVKKRVKIAQAEGNFCAYTELMGDLTALECCLVGQVTLFFEELDKAA